MMLRKISFLLAVLAATTAVVAQERHSLRRLTTEDGLPSNTVRNIVQDSEGFIWLGTDNGLCRYDGTQVRVFRNPENGIDQFVMSLQPEGDSLIVSMKSGVYSLSTRTEQFHPLKGGKPQTTGRGDRLQTHDGRLWIGTWDEGLMLMSADGKPQQMVSPVNDGLGNHIHKLYEYKQRYILIGCDEGLVAYDMETGRPALWDTPKFVYAIMCDHEGGLWLGTFYDGVYYVNDASWRFEGVPGHVISRFCEDGAGRLWLASDDAGLSCMAGGVVQDYVGRQELQRANVHALLADGDRLWVGTYSEGVYRLSGASVRHYTTDDGLLDNSSYVIHRDGRQLWVATMDGLCRYDEATDRFELARRIDAVAMSMATQQGRLWIATQGAGLYSYDGETWKQYRNSNDTTSLSDDQVNCVMPSQDGRLWVATQSGLCLYQPATDNFRRVSDVSVSSIIDGDHGDNLWLSTTKGVLKFSVSTGQTVAFTREDGLVGTQFQPNAGFRDSQGYIYFGTANGYSRFLPGQIQTNQLKPQVCITGLEVFNRAISVGDELMPEALTRGGRLELSYNDRMFSLHYTALSYVSPSKNQYAYRLEGFDREWNYVGNQTKATYTNLPPGRYTFRVKATNNDGLWSDHEAALVIVVSPPFWWSWPARILYLALAIAAIWYYIRLRLQRAEQHHREEMLRLSEAKEREVREARLNFFTTIAHEIRTPVSLIIGPLQMINEESSPSTLHASLQIIDRNAHRLLELVNQLLDFRKVEQQSLVMHFAPHNIYDLLQAVCVRFTPTFEQGGKQFDISYPDRQFTAIVDREGVTKVVSNLLTNANKYARTRVQLNCYVEADGDHFRIEVSDDGVGISDADLKRIFEPFFQAQTHKPGTGIGLSIVKNIVSLHQGQVKVESQEGQGTRFIVTLPVVQDITEEQDNVSATIPEPSAEAMPNEDMEKAGELPAVLLVEDDADLRAFLSAHFAHHYTVYTASNGLEALPILRKHTVTLIVSDWMMPGMDGAEFCRRLRANSETSHIPLILLTAKTDDESKAQSMDMGADAYIEKPFSLKYLDATIRNLIKRRRELMSRFAQVPEEPIEPLANNAVDNEFLTRMNDIIEENVSNSDFNVNMLAEQMNVSRSSLFAKIKAITDTTPNEMIQVVRLKHAAKLLADGKYRINEVCYKVGFNSPSYFTKCFYKQFGKKPGEVLKR